MTTVTSAAGEPRLTTDVPFVPRPARTGADLVFRVVLFASGAVVLLIIGAITLYLVQSSWRALSLSGVHFLVSDQWSPPRSFGILGDLMGSVLIAAIALVVALPIALATALMINEYAPRRARGWLTGLVDLLASVPSLVFGLWGLNALSTYVFGASVWLSHHASAIPLFRDPVETYGNSIFLSGLVVGIMILPIVTAVSRDVMAQAPREACEAALALGGTKWGMVTDVILPFSRNGIVAAALLGLGRAMGETIAVLTILSMNNTTWTQILRPGGGAIGPLIANAFETSPPRTQSALVLAGLTLFATTLVINVIGRLLVNRVAKVRS
jgi:phosphate transport system permease protein